MHTQLFSTQLLTPTALHPLLPSLRPLIVTSEVSNGILTRLHPRSHIPIFHKTRPDQAPDTSDVSHAERDAVAFEVDGAEGGAGQVGADEDALDLDGAAFELGGLEGDDDCGAVLCGCGRVLAVLSLSSRKRGGNGDVLRSRDVGGSTRFTFSCSGMGGRNRKIAYTSDLGSMIDKVHRGVGIVAESYLLVHEHLIGKGIEDLGLLVLRRIGLGGVGGAAEGVVF